MYNRILVPTDGSETGEAAIQHAIELAAAHDAMLYAIYVVNTASYGGLPMETSWEGVRDVLTDEGNAALDRVEDLAGDLLGETSIVDGSPASRIVAFADDHDCDLIVMGTHGRSGVDRLLLGSVAERVVRTSAVPVLTVRVGDDERPAPTDASTTTETTSSEQGDADLNPESPDDPGDHLANVDGV